MGSSLSSMTRDASLVVISLLHDRQGGPALPGRVLRDQRGKTKERTFNCPTPPHSPKSSLPATFLTFPLSSCPLCPDIPTHTQHLPTSGLCSLYWKCASLNIRKMFSLISPPSCSNITSPGKSSWTLPLKITFLSPCLVSLWLPVLSALQSVLLFLLFVFAP